MASKALFFVVGCLIGGGVAAVVWRGAASGEKASTRAPRRAATGELNQANEQLRKRNDELTAEIGTIRAERDGYAGQLERLRAPAPKPELKSAPQAAPSDEELEAGLKKFAQRLRVIWTQGDKEAVAELRALLKRAGPKAIERLKKEWEDTSVAFQRRVVAAHILAQSGNPDALEALKATLRDPDQGTFEQRIASHALAFSDAEGLEPLLTEVARKGKESGARANAAFGLARRGVEEGIQLYMQATDDAFEKGNPAAIAYMSGLPAIGQKAAPYVRERLGTYKDETGLLSLIEIAKSFKDKLAIPALEKLAYDASQPKSIQKAAEGAIRALGGKDR